MAEFTNKFQSSRQDWETPPDLFAVMHAEFSFTLDAAANENNTKVPGSYFDAASDGLSQDWGRHTVWLNPPYGDTGGKLRDWVLKAHNEAVKGATVVMLIPARTTTSWFHDICLAYGEVRFIKGRPKFIGAKYGLPQPLCYVIFRPLEYDL